VGERPEARELIEMASLRHPSLLDIGAFDRDSLLVTVANGVLDLRTGDLRPPRPDDFLTKALDVAYDPVAACPRFLQFLSELFPSDTEEMIGFLQRLVGLCLTGVVRDHLLTIFWGDGSNGKTTLLKILRALLGPFFQVAPFSLLLETRGSQTQIPNDVARLVGVRCVVCTETAEGGRLNEDVIKKITGSDPLVGRFLHKEYFDFDPTHKVLLITNHKPMIRGRDPRCGDASRSSRLPSGSGNPRRNHPSVRCSPTWVCSIRCSQSFPVS
jgi:putative DNA primase/helicase